MIAERLTARGAGHACYVVSSMAEVDGREMSLEDALEFVVGSLMGTFVSCIQGRLAYCEGEEIGERYVFARPPG